MLSTLNIVVQYAFLTHPALSAEPQFDGQMAFANIEQICLTGQRYYDAPKRDKAIMQLVDRLEQLDLDVSIQNFMGTVPGSTHEYSLHNIIAKSHHTHTNRVILASHWDTRPWAEESVKRRHQNKPIQGANDGTSGLAAILEIMRVLNQNPLQNLSVDVIFFDGEELGKPGKGGYCRGSEYFVQHLDEHYSNPPIGVVVLDMIADHSLRIEQEYHSIRTHPVWWNGLSAHLADQDVPINHSPMAIKDDQYPFIEKGIPAALIIDMDYPYWHTPDDTVDKCSPQSLEKVGQAMLNWLRSMDDAYGTES